MGRELADLKDKKREEFIDNVILYLSKKGGSSTNRFAAQMDADIERIARHRDVEQEAKERPRGPGLVSNRKPSGNLGSFNEDEIKKMVYFIHSRMPNNLKGSGDREDGVRTYLTYL